MDHSDYIFIKVRGSCFNMCIRNTGSKNMNHKGIVLPEMKNASIRKRRFKEHLPNMSRNSGMEPRSKVEYVRPRIRLAVGVKKKQAIERVSNEH